jgi:asparagine synthase (glutamine-hydrolysing)
VSVQAGIWNLDGKIVDRKLLAAISEAMKRQGPDGERFHLDGSIALLYRPFYTTAESRREKQPFLSRRGFALTWDGRLDNRDDLIADLHSDLEVEPTDVAIVGAAFDRWETNCFRRIIGDWAMSVWKPLQRDLVLAVDYIGIRHIFYYLRKDRIWWSTDLAPLVLFSGETLHIDDDYIAGYFAQDPDADLTPYREIREVPPGKFAQINIGGLHEERYWRFSTQSRIRYKKDTEYEEHFRHVFRQSVRRRLRSDSPILAELSGGLDSSSIVCMADDVVAAPGTAMRRVDTLSFYDKTEPNGDDWIYFQKVEGFRRRIGHHIDTSQLGTCPASLEYIDFVPLPGHFAAATALDAERAAVVQNGGYRAVLSGIGGDEFLGGVPDPHALLADLIVQFRFGQLAKQLVQWSLVKRKPFLQLLWQSCIGLLPNSVGQYLSRDATIENWIENKFAVRTQLALRQLGVAETFDTWLPSRRSYFGGVSLIARKMAKWTPSVVTIEETRYPYLDQDLIEFILSIPASQILRPGERRSLMRRSLAGIVPREILSRRTKQFGARTPLVALANNFEQLLLAFDSPICTSLGYINQGAFLDTLHAATNGTKVHTVRLLKAISLEFWLRSLISRGLIDPVVASPSFQRSYHGIEATNIEHL